jgi:hypothetical protein
MSEGEEVAGEGQLAMSHYSKTTAIHEAGHAIAFLAMGVPVERVDVYAKHGEKGKLRVGGRVRTPDGRVTTIRQEVTGLYAGPIAEARHRRCSNIDLLLSSGRSDLEQIKELLAELSHEAKERAHKECEAIARAIVKERWVDILALANTLVRIGHVVEPRLEKPEVKDRKRR